MTADAALDGARWAEIERLYHAALDLAPGTRAAFLEDACGDAGLRDDVRALLDHDTLAEDFLEAPVFEQSLATLVDGQAPLAAGARLGDYEIVELIGAGGMGEVYRARDRRLERDVALKVVERDGSADAAASRGFEQEARAACGLTHPHIVTVYGVGEENGTAFIAMELVRGVTLRQRLAEARPDTAEAIRWAVQLADALAVAHDSGVVHRDLKPDNIMVADGRVKILDFGIARRATEAGRDDGHVRGTVGYMSPEQAAGAPVDHRTDQFSFGAVVYEMLTGQRAFDGASTRAVIDAVATADPPPVQRLNPAVPAGIRALIDRCLAKRPDDRFVTTRQLADELAGLAAAAARDATRRLSRRQWLAVSGAAAASVAAGGWYWTFGAAGRGPRSIVVLPFDTAGGGSDTVYLGEGLSDNLLRLLSFVPDLDVRARSAGFHIRDHQIDPREAGRLLRADSVLAGTIRRDGDRLQVAARLIDVATGRDIWSDDYSRQTADAEQLQRDLARAIVVEGIRRRLTVDAERRLSRPMTVNPDAFDRYLRAEHFHRLQGEANYRRARQLLQAAVSLDPAFALAHVALSSTHTVMTVDGYERPSLAWPASNRSVRRALEVDGELPEAHAEQASAWFFFDHDWAAAESAWKRAIDARSSPTLTDLLAASALKLWALGRIDDALSYARRACRLDPLTPRFARQEADLLLHAGRPAEAIQTYEALVADEPDDLPTLFGLSEACWRAGDATRALEVRQTAYEIGGAVWPARGAATPDAEFAAILRAEAAAELDAFTARAARGEYVSPLEVARTRVRLGDAEGALRDLDAAFEEVSPGLVFLRADPVWAPMRADARFQAAVEAVGLP